MKTIYLAGPLRDCKENECSDWRKECKDKLSGWFNLLDPMRNNYKEHEIADRNELVSMDKKDIIDSDIVLANTWKISVGTSMEILFAFEHHKIIIVIGEEKNLSPWTVFHATKILPNVQEAIKYIKEKLI